jgi:hypothetical protein
MLGNSMRKYVISENKNIYSKKVQAVYKSRIKKYARRALQDLALLAEKLPEDQRAEIFTEQNTFPLFRALLKQTPEELTRLAENEDLSKEKRQRLLPLIYNIITLLNDSNLSHLIAPVGARYLVKEGVELAHLKAIYYRSQSDREDEE